jgi:ElaB/YqjD/DUF883 family membrane-anchored ribosome-binding protein
MNKLTVDLDEVNALAQTSKEIVLKPNAEVALLALLEIKARVDTAIDRAKYMIDQEAQKISCDWRSITSDHLKVRRKQTGAIFEITNPETLPADMLKEYKRTALDTAQVTAYIETNDRLPDGVGYRERGYMIDIKADGVEI